ncbi:hypothetical protein [Lysinibacillus sp. NPDC096259]|uniref:hypothetical protein n=1 Tax=Lysinibacillus sp. NPDC096259 TaxID=3390583 RepID=UPI003CFD624F
MVFFVIVLITSAFAIWTPQPTIWVMQLLASKNNPENFGADPSNLPALMEQTQVISDISYPSLKAIPDAMYICAKDCDSYNYTEG